MLARACWPYSCGNVYDGRPQSVSHSRRGRLKHEPCSRLQVTLSFILRRRSDSVSHYSLSNAVDHGHKATACIEHGYGDFTASENGMSFDEASHLIVSRQRTARVAGATTSPDSSTHGYNLHVQTSASNSETAFAMPANPASSRTRAIAPTQLLTLRAPFLAVTPRYAEPTPSATLPAFTFPPIASTISTEATPASTSPAAFPAANQTPPSSWSSLYSQTSRILRSPSALPYPLVTVSSLLDFVSVSPTSPTTSSTATRLAAQVNTPSVPQTPVPTHSIAGVILDDGHFYRRFRFCSVCVR